MVTKVSASLSEGVFDAQFPIAPALVIPLDTAGNGKLMASQTLTAASAITFSGPIEQGNCTFCLVGDGNSTHVPTFPGWKLGNTSTYDYTLDAKNIYAGRYQYGDAYLYGTGAGANSAPVTLPATALSLDGSDNGVFTLDGTLATALALE